MTVSAPALPPRPASAVRRPHKPGPGFWPELPRQLAALPVPASVPVVWEGERPAGRHVYIEPGARSEAWLEEGALRLVVAAGDEAFALALVAAYVTPEGQPAAADAASLDLLALVGRVAARGVSVLIEGPTGSGKEGLARLVHGLSPRRARAFVAVNCAALPEAMLEATLFGHERGAFTGAVSSGKGLFREADGGTLMLDEVAELPLALQAKLLRALQEREVLPVGATRPVKVDVRIVACGNRDLAAEVAEGRFRADLYYRLAVFPLKSLPLAARPADVPAIAAAWLLRRALEAGEACVGFVEAAALARLAAHGWPGNVRELGNVLDRALVMGDGATIAAGDLVFDMAAPVLPVAMAGDAPLAGVVREQEARAIAQAVAGSPTRRAAAARLGISERTLRYKLAGMAGRGTRPPLGSWVQ
ncbi:MAG: sigma 54-interacting transcriptional regulator [Polymorphobacter sp.]|uniref:sigma 54-interacting transcriptional regulator n=1 Tax=Polymorphobacter sp. TaxID=1909290 RepID=UPI003A89FF3D